LNKNVIVVVVVVYSSLRAEY